MDPEQGLLPKAKGVRRGATGVESPRQTASSILKNVCSHEKGQSPKHRPPITLETPFLPVQNIAHIKVILKKGKFPLPVKVTDLSP